MEDSFARRERALEDEFFHRVDEKLREELRESMRRDRTREALAASTGLADPELLDELVDSGITATTLVALAMVPAVMVAWADGDVKKEEREAIMELAKERGIQDGSLPYQVLEKWLLVERPKRTLLETWNHYAHAVKETMSDDAWSKFCEEVIEQANNVAHAAGGIFGYGKVSATEKNMIEKIREALAG